MRQGVNLSPALFALMMEPITDLGPSIKEAFRLISFFTDLSGLKVNQDKSQISPIDAGAQKIADSKLKRNKYLQIFMYPCNPSLFLSSAV